MRQGKRYTATRKAKGKSQKAKVSWDWVSQLGMSNVIMRSAIFIIAGELGTIEITIFEQGQWRYDVTET